MLCSSAQGGWIPSVARARDAIKQTQSRHSPSDIRSRNESRTSRSQSHASQTTGDQKRGRTGKTRFPKDESWETKKPLLFWCACWRAARSRCVVVAVAAAVVAAVPPSSLLFSRICFFSCCCFFCRSSRIFWFCAAAPVEWRRKQVKPEASGHCGLGSHTHSVSVSPSRLSRDAGNGDPSLIALSESCFCRGSRCRRQA